MKQRKRKHKLGIRQRKSILSMISSLYRKNSYKIIANITSNNSLLRRLQNDK